MSGLVVPASSWRISSSKPPSPILDCDELLLLDDSDLPVSLDCAFDEDPPEDPEDSEEADAAFDAALALDEPELEDKEEDAPVAFDAAFEDKVLLLSFADCCDDDLLLDLLDDACDDDLLLDLLDDDCEDVLAGDRSALLPDPVSIAMIVPYVVTVTVPKPVCTARLPTHISSSRTTVSTPAFENTIPGRSP